MRSARFGLLFSILLLTVPAWAQDGNEGGFQAWGTYHIAEFDSINVQNQNLDLHIPLTSYPQRGDLPDFSNYVAYRPFSWQVIHQSGTIVYYEPVMYTGFLDVHMDHVAGWSAFANRKVTPNQFAYHVVESSGAQHILGSISSTVMETVDGSGFKLVGNDVTDKSGITYCQPPTCLMKDMKGNTVTYPTTSAILTDSVGRNLPFIFPGNRAAGCSTYAYPGVNGASAPVTLCFGNITITSNFQTSGVQDKSYSVSVLQSVTLPNAKTWLFNFNSWGDLESVTTPAGGIISYNWVSIDRRYCGEEIARAVSSRTVNANDGTPANTWNYSTGIGSGISTGLITDPLGNDTYYTFSHIGGCQYVETKVQYYNGSHLNAANLLKTVDTQNSVSGVNPYWGVDGLEVSYSILPILTKTTWPSGQVRQTCLLYDSMTNGPCSGAYNPSGTTFFNNNSTSGTTYPFVYGSIVLRSEYDYGSGNPGSLMRQTNSQFQWQLNGSYLTANLLDRVASTTTLDGGNHQAAQTTYGYDENNGSPQGVYGNQTSVTRWLNGGASPKTQYVYNSQGMRIKMCDPIDLACANPTVYSYDSTGAFLTQVQYPNTNTAPHIETFSYDSNTGLMNWHKDQNGQQTSYGYDSMRRLTSVSYPDGGSDTYSYNDSVSSPSFTFTKTATPDPSFIAAGFVDGFGRQKQTKTTVPSSTCSGGYSYVDTTYDNEGRKFSVSNPYCTANDTTYGLTKTYYDVLNRMTSVVEQDGSTVSTNYASFPCTTVTDEAGKVRKLCADGLGRMTGVWEDPNVLNYPTSYTYDAIDNLLSVTQSGSRQRTFTYDSLSRLTSANNPESGLMCYAVYSGGSCQYQGGFDANGNLLKRTDARGITTTDTYDALNRITSKAYGDGTPAVYFYYDLDPSWIPGLTNIKGRLVEAYNQYAGSSGTTQAAATVFSYDAMGRVVDQWQQTPSASPGGYNVYFSYDLVGDLTSLTYPSTRKVTYQYNGAMQPTQVTFASFNGTSVGYNYMSSAIYAPTGGPTSVTLGSGVIETECYNKRLQPGNMQIASGTFSWLNRTYNFYPSGSGGCTSGTSGDNGNVIGIADNLQSNRTQTFGYDSLNRISTAQSAATSGADCWGQSFGYDAWANLLSESATKCSGGQLSVSVNTQNRITNTGVSYDLAGDMLTDGVHTYAYDGENRISSMNSGAATYVYGADGNRVRKATGSGATEYFYSPDGRVLSENNPTTGVWTDYIFSGSRRLASATGSNVNSITNGSFEQGLTSWSTLNATLVNNAANAHSGNNYVLLTSTGGAGAYAENQLVSVKPGDQLTFGGWVYLEAGTGGPPGTNGSNGWFLAFYNVSGTVISYCTPGGTITLSAWTYLSGTCTVPTGAVSVLFYAQIYQPTSSPTRIRFDDGFLSTGTSYYHGDHLGSARVMSDTGGNVIWSATYLPFGEEWNPQPTVNHYKFTGKERDSESGLDNFGARYDSSQYGRFMTPDSTAYSGLKNPQSWNLYAYTLNNPLRYVDPTGHTVECKTNAADCLSAAQAAVGKNAAGQLSTKTTQSFWQKIFGGSTTTLQINGSEADFRGASGNASKLADLIDSKTNFGVSIQHTGDPQYSSVINSIVGGGAKFELQGGAITYTPSQGYLPAVFLDPSSAATVDTDAARDHIPPANMAEKFAHELLGHEWGEVFGGHPAGSAANKQDAINSENEVRRTDPSQGQKTEHHD